MKNTKKLGHYLALTVGAGAAVTSAEGAILVTFYTPQNQTNSAGISVFSANFGSGPTLIAQSTNGFGCPATSTTFTQGSDFGGKYGHPVHNHNFVDVFDYGASYGDNYASLDLNGDSIWETVAKFNFSAGSGYLMSLATDTGGAALSISAGKAAIDGTSAVPEVSGHLALLALGSAGVLTRRRLKRAA